MKLTHLILLSAMAAILIAAATPNFLDAQVRQRLARAYADLPVLAAAAEAYKIDHGKYPFDGYTQNGPPVGYNYWYLPWHITSPVAYLDTMLPDPFREDAVFPANLKDYRYINIRSTWGTDYFNTTPSTYLDETLEYWGEFHVVCAGPDGVFGPYNTTFWYNPPINYPGFNLPYDPTNGLVSPGDIDRGQKVPPYLN